VGEIAKTTAAIMCFTIAPEYRGNQLQVPILNALKTYAKEKGWTSIEAYPFSDAAIEKHGPALLWPGTTTGYERAGFQKIQNHWIASPDAERFIYEVKL
jgi:hypothetical protein